MIRLGVIKVVVTSSEPLKKKTLEALETSIKSIVGPGKTIDMSVQIKEDILGGLQVSYSGPYMLFVNSRLPSNFQVMIGDKFLDLSVGSRVAELSKYLETAEL